MFRALLTTRTPLRSPLRTPLRTPFRSKPSPWHATVLRRWRPLDLRCGADVFEKVFGNAFCESVRKRCC